MLYTRYHSFIIYSIADPFFNPSTAPEYALDINIKFQIKDLQQQVCFLSLKNKRVGYGNYVEQQIINIFVLHPASSPKPSLGSCEN